MDDSESGDGKPLEIDAGFQHRGLDVGFQTLSSPRFKTVPGRPPFFVEAMLSIEDAPNQRKIETHAPMCEISEADFLDGQCSPAVNTWHTSVSLLIVLSQMGSSPRRWRATQ
jgi:hypothetical protein